MFVTIMWVVVCTKWLAWEVLKHNGGKFKSGPETPLHIFPEQLAKAAEHFLLDRMELGEEVGIDLVQNLMRSLVEVWNSKIDELRNDMIAVSGPKILEDHDAKLQEGCSAQELEQVQDLAHQQVEALLKSLKPIELNTNVNALMQLDIMSMFYYKRINFLKNIRAHICIYSISQLPLYSTSWSISGELHVCI